MLEVQHLTKAYDNVLVLDNASFKNDKNKILVLQGPNGSPKITIIKLISDLIQPTFGKILFFDQKIKFKREKNIY
jgi:ABC-type multidrug transport system ATPase subunit